jgi:hypothetical protein
MTQNEMEGFGLQLPRTVRSIAFVSWLGKIKLPLYVTNYCAMKTYGGVEV